MCPASNRVVLLEDASNLVDEYDAPDLLVPNEDARMGALPALHEEGKHFRSSTNNPTLDYVRS
jgi:hypothetical protein